MSRSRHAKPGSQHNTRDLVGRGAHYEPQTPDNKRLLRKKNRSVLKRSLLWLKNNCFSIEFINLKCEDM